MSLDWGNRSRASPFLPGVGGTDAVKDKTTSTPGVGGGFGGLGGTGRTFVPGQLRGNAINPNRGESANERALRARGKLAFGKGRPVAPQQALSEIDPVAPMPEAAEPETSSSLPPTNPGSLFPSVPVDPNAALMFIRC